MYLVIIILTKLILKCFYFYILKFWYLKPKVQVILYDELFQVVLPH